MHKLNCGLTALEKITKLETASMFTLIHLAKDNGINLYFCNVEPEELVKVARPAIFHQDNHFVFVKDGDPMPAGDYDGYVLTPKPINEPLPYSLAKKIRGQKKRQRGMVENCNRRIKWRDYGRCAFNFRSFCGSRRIAGSYKILKLDGPNWRWVRAVWGGDICRRGAGWA